VIGNATNSNKTNSNLSPQLFKHKKKTTTRVWCSAHSALKVAGLI